MKMIDPSHVLPTIQMAPPNRSSASSTPEESLIYLKKPLKKFLIPTVDWKLTKENWVTASATCLVHYQPPQPVKVNGEDRLKIIAYQEDEGILGAFFLPPSYELLWRRLVYGAFYWEKMFGYWEEMTQRMGKGKKRTARQRAVIISRNNVGVILVQYLLSRRLVLEEIMKQPLGCPGEDPILECLIEFGIRHHRDWFSLNFKSAKKEAGQFLKIDPRPVEILCFLSEESRIWPQSF